jgi:hypothetical protein
MAIPYSSIKDGSTWRIAKRGVQINDGGNWRQVRYIYYNDGGTWREVFIVWVPNTTIVNTSGSGAIISFESDSRFTTTADGVTSSPSYYYGTTTSSAIGLNFWLRYTQVNGDALSAGSMALNTWLQLSTTRSIAYLSFEGVKGGTFTGELALDSGGATVVSEFTVNLTNNNPS